jgi:phosphosulfolactate synthase (CoM biosynthesis protein A)
MADKDPRHVDRAEEEKRQKAVQDAVDKGNAEARAEAEEALRRQGVYETTGVRVVEGKP